MSSFASVLKAKELFFPSSFSTTFRKNDGKGYLWLIRIKILFLLIQEFYSSFSTKDRISSFKFFAAQLNAKRRKDMCKFRKERMMELWIRVLSENAKKKSCKIVSGKFQKYKVPVMFAAAFTTPSWQLIFLPYRVFSDKSSWYHEHHDLLTCERLKVMKPQI